MISRKKIKLLITIASLFLFLKYFPMLNQIFAENEEVKIQNIENFKENNLIDLKENEVETSASRLTYDIELKETANSDDLKYDLVFQKGLTLNEESEKEVKSIILCKILYNVLYSLTG
ncbi:hypothetical protein [Atopobacter phocae]|uniref:hypothetical protein n=1 Tax=Atopobacter phocae TaxID=136492 RepID=UPI00047252CA|nr:hypothetical protein [Atopobacter phocae]